MERNGKVRFLAGLDTTKNVVSYCTDSNDTVGQTKIECEATCAPPWPSPMPLHFNLVSGLLYRLLVGSVNDKVLLLLLASHTQLTFDCSAPFSFGMHNPSSEKDKRYTRKT